jgi:dihydrofolate synthase / folylpolyglutamate synthase
MTAHSNIDSLLKPFQRFGVNLGLERIDRLLKDLGNPQERVPIVHVAGTNGKGSVCAYLSSILTEAGYKVGRYISPHLVDWTERICINDRPISQETLAEIILDIQKAIDPTSESPTQFEVITAAAWLYFARSQVDIAVMEVGLGGRLDATNVCSNPLIAIVTSISREHWQNLGPTVADIAREKAGILKKNRPAVIGILPPEAKKVVGDRASSLNCPTVWIEPATEKQGSRGDKEQGLLGKGAGEQGAGEISCRSASTPTNLCVFSPAPYPPTPLTVYSQFSTPAFSDFVVEPRLVKYQDIEYPLPLLGDVQLINSAIAIASVLLLQQQGWQISLAAIQTGMAKTRWLGRLQWTSWKDNFLLIDGAHNTAAAQALRQYTDTLDKPITWVMGMLSTKDHADIFQALLKSRDRLYLVPVPDRSTANPEALAKLASQTCPNLDECQTFADLFIALKAAFNNTSDSDRVVVLCGSLYLLGHFFKP